MLARAVPSLLAAVGLAVAGAPGPPVQANGVVLVAICGDPTHRIPLPQREDDKQNRPCPMGCHAVCPRRDSIEEDE